MRNLHNGTCYRCGKEVAPGDGHFEKVTSKQRKRWGALIKGINWLTQHARCANQYRNTDVHYLIDPAILDENGKIIDEPVPVECPYCHSPAEPATGDQVYAHRPDLNALRLYRCVPCGAHVGCHKGTWKPFGTLARGPRRIARNLAHAAFDPLWQAKKRRDACSTGEARDAAYAWLANLMGMTRDECHIAMMDEAQCAQVVRICRDARRKEAA